MLYRKIGTAIGLLAAVAVMLSSRTTIRVGDQSSIEVHGRPDVIPMDLQSSGVMLIKASVMGHPGVFLIDTGAVTTTLNLKFANKLGLSTTKPSWIYGVIGLVFPSSCQGETRLAMIDEIRLGETAFRKVRVNVYDLSNNSAGMDRPLDGIIGLDIWRRCGFRLDGVKRQITLFPPAPSSSHTRSAPYCFQGLFLFANPMMMAEVEINAIKCRMVVDTGSAVTCLGAKDWKRLKASTLKEVSRVKTRVCDWNTSAPGEMEILHGQKIQCGDFAKSDRSIWHYELRNYHNTNILGMDFLGPQVLTILPYGNQIYFE